RLVMIARALAQKARLIVLDEPSASLTNVEIEQLHGVVRRLSAKGVAIVYVSHRLSEIRALTSRTVVMRDGRVVAERDTSTVDHDELVHLITGGSAAPAQAQQRRAAPGPTSPSGDPLLEVRGLAAGTLLKD